ncbi:MAG: hypothetical protein AAGI53_02335 [Planctomycetota bacterium]
MTTPLLAVLLVSGPIGLAQPSGESDRAKRATQQSIEQAERVLPSRGTAADPVLPTPAPSSEPPRPGLTGGFSIDEALRGMGVDISEPAALPEGTFLSRRAGSVYLGPAGIAIFIPGEEQAFPGEGPMVLAPNTQLERLEASLAEGETLARFVVSGEVLLYRERNHLLISAFSRRGGGEVLAEASDQGLGSSASADLGADPGAEPEGDAEPGSTGASVPLDPSVAEIINELRERRASSSDDESTPSDARFRQLDRNDPAARLNPEREPGLVPEGRYLTQRRVRLDRTPNGRWTVVFDNDTDRPGAADGEVAPPPPMPVIPCRVLERMEATAELFGDAAAMIVSGRVFTYEGVNYLKPTMYALERPGDVDPIQ